MGVCKGTVRNRVVTWLLTGDQGNQPSGKEQSREVPGRIHLGIDSGREVIFKVKNFDLKESG